MSEHGEASVAAKVIERLSRSLPADLQNVRVTNESVLREDLGLDSLRTVDLVIELEDEFQISIETEDLGAVRTVGDLVLLIERKRGASST
jgi:acyl carrier protein